MASAVAGMGPYPRSTSLDAITHRLSSEQGILMTHVVVWLLVFLSGVFLALRLFAIWYRKCAVVLDDGLLAASWVSKPPLIPLSLFLNILAGLNQKPTRHEEFIHALN